MHILLLRNLPYKIRAVVTYLVFTACYSIETRYQRSLYCSNYASFIACFVENITGKVNPQEYKLSYAHLLLYTWGEVVETFLPLGCVSMF